MKYQRVYTAFWPETKDWGEGERMVALYLLTCKHRQLEGLYSLPVAYAAHDMGWEPGRIAAAEERLTTRGWLLREGDWVLIVNALRFDQPNRGNATTHAVKAVSEVPTESAIYRRFYASASEFCPQFADALPAPSRGSSNALPGGSTQAQEGCSLSSSSSRSSSSSSSSNSTASKPADVLPPAAVAPDVARVSEILADAGMQLLSTYQLEQDVQDLPTIDIVEVATRMAERYRGQRVTNPTALLHTLVVADDAPRKPVPGSVSDFSAYDAKTIREAA